MLSQQGEKASKQASRVSFFFFLEARKAATQLLAKRSR